MLVASPMRLQPLGRTFGAEYALLPRWNLMEQGYIRVLGFVDLPGRLRARLVIRELQKFRWNSLLDLGCGTGCYSYYFSRWQNVQVRGIDTNPSRVSDCKTVAQRLARHNLEFLAGAAEDLLRRFESNSVDAALAIEILQYLPNVKLGLLEVQRLLRPGGYLVGHVPVLGYLREYETSLFDDENLAQLLRDTGFEIVTIKPTFDGTIRRFCRIYDLCSRSRVLTALVFPFLLIASLPYPIASCNGDYRLFVARKPLIAKEALM